MNAITASSRALPINASLDATASLLGRVGLSLIFIISGWGKIAGYAGTQQYMEAMGVPGGLLPLVIALELGGGLAILGGVFTRWIALALAAFSLASAALFHADFGDAAQAINFWKNVAMAGGFLMLAAHGAGSFSLDHALGKRRNA
jgi:putative oxidoreductase